MKRCIDIIGIAGFVILVISTLLLFPHSAEKMTWTYWLEGLVLWFVGFAMLVGWLLLRWSIPQRRGGPPPLVVWSVPESNGEGVAADASRNFQREAA
jgi:membrane-bound ClpP family serine protease